MKSRRPSFLSSALLAIAFAFAFAAYLLAGDANLLAALLLARPHSKPCIPEEEMRQSKRTPAAPLRSITDEEINAFHRDGSVLLKGVLDEKWVGRLHALVDDVFSNPNGWDVLYSRFVANFYCAQKAILVHHTSVCGRQIAEVAPTTAIAAKLLRTSRLRVCEPTDALGNFHGSVWWGRDGCGTTGFHTDDAYIPVARRDASKAAIVRLWIPLARFSTSKHMLFATLNESESKRAERAALSGVVSLNGTKYALHERLLQSKVLEKEGQVIKPEEYMPGDILAFAGEVPHTAEAIDCSPQVGHCLRLILSFSGDNAVYTRGRKTGLIPLHDNQTVGKAPQGKQFPTVWPMSDETDWEWEPLRPSPSTLLESFVFAVRAGSSSFTGSSLGEAMRYVARVSWFASPVSGYALGLWDAPPPAATAAAAAGGVGKREVSLLRHFGTLAAEALVGAASPGR